MSGKNSRGDITISVKTLIQADAKSMKQSIEEFASQIGDTLKEDSSLQKSLSKQLKKVQDEARDIQLIGEQNFITRSDQARVERITKDFYRRMTSMQEEYKQGLAKNFNIPQEYIDKIHEIEKAYKKIEPAQQRTDRRKLKDASKDAKLGLEASAIQEEGKRVKVEVKETDTFKSYSSRIGEEKEKVSKQLNTLNADEKTAGSISHAAKAVAVAAEKLSATEEKARAGQLGSLKPQVTKYNNIPTAKKAYGAIQEIAKSPIYYDKADIQTYLRNLVFKQGTTEFLSSEEGIIGDQTALGILKFLGADSSVFRNLDKLSKGKNADLGVFREQLAQAFNQTISGIRVKEYKGIRDRAQTFVTNTETVVGDTQEVSEARKQVTGLEANVTELEGKRDALITLQTDLSNLSERVSSLEDVFLKEDEKAVMAERGKLAQQKREAEAAGKAAVQGDTRHALELAEGVARNQSGLKEEIGENDRASREAESFKARMQQAVKQWMGAREIINYVKKGVREAYKDIQNLDKAMTNIAVVTDFSTEDLWGQINDYMAIAKQYGVTTQGVYEVTQLFYQQGLGTSDTMAATVETLKMARIAGMGYSDAADGMTVA